MLEGIGDKIDGILEVQEINTDNYSDVRPLMANAYMRSDKAMDTEAAMPDIDFKTIKVRAEVRAVFLIK
jgi:L-rhamnose isomerase